MCARRGRAARCARQVLSFLFTNVGVVLLVLAYIIAGAFMFQKIEGASEMERDQNMVLEREATVQFIWENITLPLNPYNDTELEYRQDLPHLMMYCFCGSVRIGVEMLRYQEAVVRAVRRGWDGGHGRRWSFSCSFLYCLTVITTIGYGNLSPRTSLGKLATILYALLGMPLFLLYLTNVGELLARWFKCIYSLFCLCRGCPATERRRVLRLPRPQMDECSEAESVERGSWTTSSGAGEDHHYYGPRDWSRSSCSSRARSGDSSAFTYITYDAQTITVPISVCVAILVGYILVGSMLFGLWEKWSQLDGAYFCFISLTSIGFGDFVPGERVYTPTIETSFIACSMYLLLGMALVAMCFNLMQEQVIHYFAGLKRALKRLCRCKR